MVNTANAKQLQKRVNDVRAMPAKLAIVVGINKIRVMSYEQITHLEKITTTINIRIKGEIGFVFSLVEHQLLKIILYSKEYLAQEFNQVKPVKIKELSYAAKVSMALSALKKEKNVIFQNHEIVFDELTKAGNYRNCLIHGEYLWNINDLTHFDVWDIEVSDPLNNIQSHYKRKFSIIDVADQNTRIMKCYNALFVYSEYFENRSKALNS